MATSARVVQAAAATGGGSQSFTVSGFGTPGAYLLFASRGVANGVAANHNLFSSGAGDTTNEWTLNQRSENGQATSDADRRGATDESLMLLDITTTNVDGEANFNATVTDGIELTWGSAPAGAYLINGVLIQAAQVAAGVALCDQAQDAEKSFSVGFEPDLVFFSSGLSTSGFDDVASSAYNPQFAWAQNDGAGGVQAQWVSFASEHSNQGTSRTWAKITDNRVYTVINVGSGIPTLEVECTGFTAAEFKLTKRVGSNNPTLGYVALKLDPGFESYVGVVTTPTSTGSQSRTEPGHKPEFMMLAPTGLASVNTVDGTNGGGAGMLAVSVADATNQYCLGVSSEDGQATTDTQSLVDDQLLNVALGDGTTKFAATLTSFDATGWTWDFTTTDTGTARQCGVMTIGAPDGGPAGGNAGFRTLRRRRR